MVILFPIDSFALIADPARRRILDRLRVRESDVGGLVDRLGLPQPLVSKHLRVLREAGAVAARVDGKRRVYRLADHPPPQGLARGRPYDRARSASPDPPGGALGRGGTGLPRTI